MEPEQTPTPAPTHRKKLAPRTKTALWLLIGPSVTIGITFFLFIVLNIAFGNFPETLPEACQTQPVADITAAISPACEEELMSLQSTPELAVNIILVIVGALGVISWLPGIVIGSILLAKRPKTSTTTE